MKDDKKRRNSKAQKISKLIAEKEKEMDLKNEAYFFIIQSGNLKNFKKWVDDRRDDGLTEKTAHDELLLFLCQAKETIRLTVTDPERWEKVKAMSKGTKNHQPQSDEYSQRTNNEYLKAFFEHHNEEARHKNFKSSTEKDELIKTLLDCNKTQRELLQLQEGRITRLIEMLSKAMDKSATSETGSAS